MGLVKVTRLAECGLILSLFLFGGFSYRAQAQGGPALPIGLCALIAEHVTCFDRVSGQPRLTTPTSQPIVDFDLSPDGGWLAYRSGSTLYMAAFAGNSAPIVLDNSAPPPAAFAPEVQTLAWAPDGLSIAYVTAFGLRVIDPTNKPIEVTDRLYSQIHWSPLGDRLAVQSSDGAWTFFGRALKPLGLTRTRLYNQSADLAWLDDQRAVVAPAIGGLLLIDANVEATPEWSVDPTEHFTKLHAGSAGKVVAFHVPLDELNGGAVEISNDGTWKPFGSAVFAPREAWGPGTAPWIYYLDSGTPITVDRSTGEENTLPISHADRIAWSPGDLPEVLGVPVDADLYFLAPDNAGVAQLWRLPMDGFPLIQLSHGSQSITDYSVGADRVQYVSAGQTTYVLLDGTTPTPPPRATVRPGAPLPTASPTATPFLTITPHPGATPTFQVQYTGWQPGPVVALRLPATAAAIPSYLIERALLSPSGRYAAGFRGSQLMVLDWSSGRAVAILGIQNATAIRWSG